MDKIFRIEEMRIAAGITRYRMVKLVGCANNTLVAYETGKTKRFDIDILRKIAAILNVKVCDLFI